MKLTIVSSRPDETTVAQFKAKADELGIAASVIPITQADIATKDILHKLGDCVLWRLSALGPAGNAAGYGFMEGRISINSGLYVMPEIASKFFQQQLLSHSALSEYSIPTFYANNFEELNAFVERGLLSYPMVGKPVNGTSGAGVALIHTVEEAKTRTVWGGYIYEPYIANDGEWRVFVVGGVATGAMKKIAEEGKDFNFVTSGAKIHSEEDPETRDTLYDLATKAASLFHLELTGVDIVKDRNTGRFYIFEVNTSPGWQNGFDRVTGENIPTEVMNWFSERFAAKTQSMQSSVKTYLLNRVKRLPGRDQALLHSILSGEWQEEGAEPLETRERLIRGVFFKTSLEEKLAFAYAACRAEYATDLKETILQEAENSISWAGNFLVDASTQTTTGATTTHTLLQNYRASALYCAIIETCEHRA